MTFDNYYNSTYPTRIGFLCDTNKIVTSTKLYPFNWITFS